MAETTPQLVMQNLLKAIEKDINESFKAYAEELIAKKTKEINDQLEKKKAEIIVNVVRNISQRYNMRSIGDTITIEILEGKK